MKDSELYEKLSYYCLTLVAKKRYTCSQIREKAEKFIKKVARNLEITLSDKEKNELVEAIAGRLMELKYLDDAQYAKDYINDCMRFRPRGKFLIRRELIKKGISKSDLESVLERTVIDEVEMAEKLISKHAGKWEKASGRAGARSVDQKSRAYRYLASRGFSADAIYNALDLYYNDNT